MSYMKQGRGWHDDKPISIHVCLCSSPEQAAIGARICSPRKLAFDQHNNNNP